MRHATHELEQLFVRFGPEQDFHRLGESYEGEDGPPELTFEMVGESEPVPRGRIRVTDPDIGERLWEAYQDYVPVGLALQMGDTPYFIQTVLVTERDRSNGTSQAYILDFGRSDLWGSDFTDTPEELME